MEVIIAILVLACIALFALWRIEVGECEDARFYSKCYCIKCDEEKELRRKAESEVDRIKAVCEALSHENANIYSEREKLRKCTVEYALTDWDKRVCEDIPGREEYERDGIVLIYERGKIVGWHSADTVQVRFKRPKRKTKTPKQSTYKAPSAEVTQYGGYVEVTEDMIEKEK